MKICDVLGVMTDDPLELWRDDETRRIVLRVITEAGCVYTEIDLADLLAWANAYMDAPPVEVKGP
jgi:hypothetical protein